MYSQTVVLPVHEWEPGSALRSINVPLTWLLSANIICPIHLGCYFLRVLRTDTQQFRVHSGHSDCIDTCNKQKAE